MEKPPRRKQLRAASWDYSQPTSYMVTICTQDRMPLLGEIRDESCCLTDAGRAIESQWLEIPERFLSVEVDQFVVMPNHLHGLIHLHHDLLHLGEYSLGDVMKWFKGSSARLYSRGVTEQGWPPFRNRFWQKNYYETIVRSDAMLERLRDYIAANPSQWPQDPENSR